MDQELARKVALQKQMLEHERQKEALGYQQSLLLQQQQQVCTQLQYALVIFCNICYVETCVLHLQEGNFLCGDLVMRLCLIQFDFFRGKH